LVLENILEEPRSIYRHFVDSSVRNHNHKFNGFSPLILYVPGAGP
jgi:hypothetical protein